MEKFKKFFAPKNMSEGAPWKRLMEFAIPMLIGNLVQQLYNTVDTVIVGNSHWGYQALAAVSSAGPVLRLLMALFVGIATGTGIIVSQYVGARNKEGLGRTIGNCITLTAIASVFSMIVGPLLIGPMLNLVNTLPELYDYSRQYLVIYFAGISGMFFYNIFSGILRGMGDSTSALLYLMTTAVLNVFGDLLLVDKYGVAGVAIATVVAQIISAILCVRKVLSLKQYVHLEKDYFKLHKEYALRIVKLGIPSGITGAISSISGLAVQRLINSFGDAMFVAANGLTIRVDGYAMMPTFSFGMAMSTFTGQNIGAGRMDRLKLGLKQCLIMSVSIAAIMTPAVLFGGPYLLRLFTPEQELNDLVMSLIHVLCIGYIFSAVSNVLQGVIRGAGDTMSPMWISMGNAIALRLVLAYALVGLTKHMGLPVRTQEQMVFLSMSIVWVTGSLLTYMVYRKGKWKTIRVINRKPPEPASAEAE